MQLLIHMAHFIKYTLYLRKEGANEKQGFGKDAADY